MLHQGQSEISLIFKEDNLSTPEIIDYLLYHKTDEAFAGGKKPLIMSQSQLEANWKTRTRLSKR